MIGGLLLSQVLTLYTTPVIYIFFDRFAKRRQPEPAPAPPGNQPPPPEES